MQIITKVRHTKAIDQALKDYAERKIGEKCITHLDETDESIFCEIEFDDQFGAHGGKDKRIDITLEVPGEHLPIHLEETAETFQAAIDLVAERLEKALLRYKEMQKGL